MKFNNPLAIGHSIHQVRAFSAEFSDRWGVLGKCSNGLPRLSHQ